ncbi:hypothetical protein ACH427_04560 [Streptomyces sp. NPDC020379]|uniref:hypothetical protein n=1 Tax=Streptomyces sp. NPDC020379 TaxID=3365071 RepID=UPI0037A2BFDA
MNESELDERYVYSLSNDHYDWADLENLAPEPPKIPDTLLPFYPPGETVDDVDELTVYAFGNEPPHFVKSGECVEATPQEMAQWRAAWASMEEAQQAFRARLEEARTTYEAAAREALADLAEAMKPWAPVDATLKARTAELATKLHAHSTAAKEYMAKKEAEKQEQLDAIHGPRVIALYKPKKLHTRNKADHVARVHLMTCKRRPNQMGNDEGLRAGEAWERLKSPVEWTRSGYDTGGKNMRVTFCSFCKPWTVFQEQIDDFPRPSYARYEFTLGEIKLTNIPEAWTP